MAGKHRSIGALRSWLVADRRARQVATVRPPAIEMVDGHCRCGAAIPSQRSWSNR